MPSPNLTPAQNEVLTLLAEECAEVIQAVTKIQRFGPDSRYDDGTVNRERLMKELGDVLAAMELVDRAGLSTIDRVRSYMLAKLARVKNHLRHFNMRSHNGE